MGKVLRVRQETIDQTVTYYFLIENAPDRLFAVPSDIADMVKMTDIGDAVTLSYQEDGSSTVDVLAFTNNSLSLRQSETEVTIETQNEGIQGKP